MTATLADTCIHGERCEGNCHPVAIVSDELFAAARAHKRATWTEIVGVGDGYSAPITGPLREQLLDAYRASAGEHAQHADSPGRLVWLRTADYERARWQPNPEYLAWQERLQAADDTERRRLLAADRPHMGRQRDQVGACLCFLTLDGAGTLRLVG